MPEKQVSQTTTDEPKKGEVLFFYPEHGIRVYAVDRESADKKLNAILNADKEENNG